MRARTIKRKKVLVIVKILLTPLIHSDLRYERSDEKEREPVTTVIGGKRQKRRMEHPGTGEPDDPKM